MKRIIAPVLAVALLAPAATFAQTSSDAPAAAPPKATEVQASAKGTPPQRYLYVASGVLLVGGLGLSYLAQGEMVRADSVTKARLSQDSLQAARTSAASANMLYILSGLTLAYGLALEFLPEKARDQADLTFHF